MWRSPWTWPWSKINFIHSLKFSTPNTHLPEISLQNDLFFTRPTKWNEPFHYVSFLLGFGAQNVTKDLYWDASWEKCGSCKIYRSAPHLTYCTKVPDRGFNQQQVQKVQSLRNWSSNVSSCLEWFVASIELHLISVMC